MPPQFGRCWDVRLPGSNTRAIWAVALFVTVQLADAVMTACGAARFGYGIEANPILQLAARGIGLPATLVAAKALAVGFALILHAHARYVILVLLTLVCVVVALLPWAWVLAT